VHASAALCSTRGRENGRPGQELQLITPACSQVQPPSHTLGAGGREFESLHPDHIYAMELRWRVASRGSVGPIRVASMIDSQDGHLAGVFVDAVQHAIGATPSTVNSFEFVAKRPPYTLRVLDERPGDELDHRCAHRFGELFCDRSRCWTGYNEFIRLSH